MEQKTQTQEKVDLLDLTMEIEGDLNITVNVEDPINRIDFGRFLSEEEPCLVYSRENHAEKLGLFKSRPYGFESIFVSHEYPLPIEKTSVIYMATKPKYCLETFNQFQGENELLKVFSEEARKLKDSGSCLTIEKRVSNDQIMLKEALYYLARKFKE